MYKKSRFRGPIHKWHGKRTERLLKSERQQLYQIYWSLWGELGFIKSLWVIYKILGLFVNPLTADNKYSVLNRDNLSQHLQMQLSQQRKRFSNFSLHFLNLDSIFNILKKDMTLIADAVLNLRIPK